MWLDVDKLAAHDDAMWFVEYVVFGWYWHPLFFFGIPALVALGLCAFIIRTRPAIERTPPCASC